MIAAAIAVGLSISTTGCLSVRAMFPDRAAICIRHPESASTAANCDGSDLSNALPHCYAAVESRKRMLLESNMGSNTSPPRQHSLKLSIALVCTQVARITCALLHLANLLSRTEAREMNIDTRNECVPPSRSCADARNRLPSPFPPLSVTASDRIHETTHSRRRGLHDLISVPAGRRHRSTKATATQEEDLSDRPYGCPPSGRWHRTTHSYLRFRLSGHYR